MDQEGNHLFAQVHFLTIKQVTIPTKLIVTSEEAKPVKISEYGKKVL